MNRTIFSKKFNSKATLVSIILLIGIAILLILLLLYAKNILERVLYSILLIFILFGIIGLLLGFLKGKRQIVKENKCLKKVNPYIYYRELPNNFGIGVASLLFDSALENYKDIVAIILDLCAKKYLSLVKVGDKYIIKVLKTVDNNLLSNEAYVLNLVINNNIKNIDYHKWYDYCIQDGIDLGLYYHKNANIEKTTSTRKQFKKLEGIHFKISLFFAVLYVIVSVFREKFLQVIGTGILLFIIIYVVLIVPFYILNVLGFFIKIGKQTKDTVYKNIIENTLIKTQLGVDELNKLSAFKAFIRDFGNFAPKSPLEIVLWDRYLSYAQVFGLTKEIMKTGYKELVDNSSFQIDNIDNINLDNIEVK